MHGQAVPTTVVVIGAGGFGRESLDVLEAANREGSSALFHILGVVDDCPSALDLERLAERGVKHLGTVEDWLNAGDEADYVLAIGNPAVRTRVAATLARSGKSAVTAVHPSAVFGSRTVVGEGAVICAGVQVSTNVFLGAHVHLNPGAIIGHDSRLSDFVSVNPGAVISGDVRIGGGSLVGAGAVVLQGLEVGAASTVGAGAVVVRDVVPQAVVKGVPAR